MKWSGFFFFPKMEIQNCWTLQQPGQVRHGLTMIKILYKDSSKRNGRQGEKIKRDDRLSRLVLIHIGTNKHTSLQKQIGKRD